jgi:hypothetical protein
VSLTIALLMGLAVFLVCTWSGQTLARHHQDRHEVAAVAAVGVCVLGMLALSRNLLAIDGALPMIVLAIAAGGGLFLGYDRADRTP